MGNIRNYVMIKTSEIIIYIPIDFMTELVVARVHNDGAKSDGKGKETLRYSCIPNLNKFYLIVPVSIFVLIHFNCYTPGSKSFHKSGLKNKMIPSTAPGNVTPRINNVKRTT